MDATQEEKERIKQAIKDGRVQWDNEAAMLKQKSRALLARTLSALVWASFVLRGLQNRLGLGLLRFI